MIFRGCGFIIHYLCFFGNIYFIGVFRDGFVRILIFNSDLNYVLTKIQRISDFILPTPNNKWQSPVNIFTDTTSDNLYIQDSSRIVEISKLGLYQRQFIIDNKQILAAFISPKDKTGWVLSGDKIYQFGL